MFRYIPPHYQAYKVASFAATRFGSHRQRPDDDAMRRIQRTAAFSATAMKADHSLSMGMPKDEGYLAAGEQSTSFA
ncbi:hypothetical protein AB6A40_009568 [Gnathostoma spinigerum]|uniref:Uncharacterized protein n=1 Tax=Gnathostoma spinigerum TaxID=75299 RepID=A0ABD6ESC1_9BILA